MNMADLKSQLPDYAKDIKLNLDNVLSEAGAPGLTAVQIMGIALTSAYVTRNSTLIQALSQEASAILSSEAVRAAKAAAVMMGMNNVYYRFLHLVEDPEYKNLRAGLRMNIMRMLESPKIDFELNSLAASAMNACGDCIKAHSRQILDAGLTREAVQSTVRISAVIAAAAQALDIEAASAASPA